MWPSLPSFYSRPFGETACPAGAKCEIPYCLFSHDKILKPGIPTAEASDVSSLDGERRAKRLKLEHGTKKPVLQSSSPLARPRQPVFVGSIARKQTSSPPNKDMSQRDDGHTTTSYGKSELPRYATRAVSPPAKAAVAQPAAEPDAPVSLIPRKVAKQPVDFMKRLALLKKLREFMAPLNDKTSQSADAEVKALKLTDNQLNKLAVDEEEKIAVQNKPVYENVLKQRLVALKRMALEGWVKERKEVLRKEKEAAEDDKGGRLAKPPPKFADTGLSAKGEVDFLSRLIANQTGLDAHGYVTKIPTDAEVEEAFLALASADHWEACDRCKTRFQVFPDRREEDGALTTGGKCQHHWGRKIYPKRSKGELPGPTRYTCCNEPVGSPGCHVLDTHVFKADGASRLSTVMQFAETPRNDEVAPHTAVCFDCEMGYTTHGLELMRLTAISWPTNQPVLDILVRPLGHILDLNTRFSGITTEQYCNAKPYDPKNPTADPKDIRIVDSPHIARDLLFSHISPSTPLLGHALENDLNAVRIVHPNIVDTVLLFPHNAGLPIRNSLRNLAKQYLQWDIQQAGAAGHDSFEDAKATGELVRFRVGRDIAVLKCQGWTIREGEMCPPLPTGTPPPPPPVEPPMESVPGGKRKFDQYDEDGEAETKE